MYTEEYDKKDYPYRNFFLKLILIIVFVLLLVWLLTKLFYNKNETNIDGLSNEIFSNNIEKMKSSALSYYGKNTLPINNNDSVKITLNKMIKDKYIIKLTDKNGKLCDQQKSYIKITKKDDEYILKINLVCDKENDYILSHLNTYSYCNNTYICEKKTNIEENNKISLNNSKQSSNNNINIKSTKKKSKKGKLTTYRGSIEVTDTTTKNYLYEYIKNNNIFSSWSMWSNWEKTNCNIQEKTCSNSNNICLNELKKYSKRENTGTYNRVYETTKISLKNISSTYALTCSNYNYVKINNILYKTNGQYSNLNTWNYIGRSSYQTPPEDTIITHYILTNIDYSNCSDTCNKLPKYYYDKYEYNSNLIQVENAFTDCENKTYKNILNYNRINEKVLANRIENSYEIICYKSERNRTIISNNRIIKTWSNYNDKKLLSNGYYYTGNKKKK